MVYMEKAYHGGILADEVIAWCNSADLFDN